MRLQAWKLALALVVWAAVGCDSGASSVGASRPANVQIAPPDPRVEIQSTLQLDVALFDANGDPVGGRSVFWSSEDISIAEVSSSGLVTGIAVGSTRIAASVEGVDAVTTVTVVPLGVATVTVDPSTAALDVDETVTLKAIVRDRNGDEVPNRPATWTAQSEQIATVDANGRVTGRSPGSTMITASVDGKSGSATIEVSEVPVASVAISPSTATIPIGQTRQFTATPRSASGAPLPGRTITWSSSDETVVAVSESGLAAAVGVGSARVVASAGGRNAEALVVVPPPPVATLEVTPSTASLNVGETRQFTASASSADGEPLPDRPISWSSSNSAVVVVSDHGLAEAKAPGSAKIVASAEGKNAEATVTVLPRSIASLTISPASASLEVGKSQQFSAIARDAEGDPITGRTVSWSSANPNVLSVSSTGLAQALAPGAARINASVDGVTAGADVTVTAVPVASIRLSPSSAEIPVLETRQFTATLEDADGNVLSGREVVWTSDSPLTASVSSSGVVLGLIPGDATITATSEGRQGTASVRVTPVPATGGSLILVSGDEQKAGNNTTLPNDLVVRLLDDRNRPIAGAVVRWTTNNGSVSPASVTTDSNGYASTKWTLGGGSGTLARRAWAEVEGIPRVEFRAYRE